MSKINFNLSLTIDECALAIKTIGDKITPIIVSEPGCGKSSILKMLEADMGTDEYDFIYVDCPVKDMMDVAASIPNHESKSLEYYVSDLFKLDNGKKKVIMLDEFMKAPKLMQIIFTRLILERTVGDRALPKGSYLFATSNNTSDGVGDSMLAHVGNRVCLIEMAKPTAEKWNVYATAKKIARPIRAWVAMTPKALRSYRDGDQSDNPYIFKPSSVTAQFVSPRSLEKASPIVYAKDVLGEHVMMTLLAGVIGEAAAKSMAAFIALESKLISYKSVIERPEAITVPDDISAQIMMMFEAVDYVDNHDDLNKYMKFVNRIPSAEVQSVFFTMMMRGKPKLARYNQEIMKWSSDNHMMM